MEITSVSNLAWADAGQTRIRADITAEGIGEIPVDVAADYDLEWGRIFHAAAVAGDHGAIADYTAPAPVVLTSEQLAPMVRAEVEQRIFVVASRNTQMNMAAMAGSGLFNAADLDAFKLGVQWINDMRAMGTTLTTSATQDFEADSHWPVVPPTAAALAAQY